MSAYHAGDTVTLRIHGVIGRYQVYTVRDDADGVWYSLIKDDAPQCAHGPRVMVRLSAQEMASCICHEA